MTDLPFAGDSDLDSIEGRRGEWMHTSLGGKFFPLDPRPEEVFMSDIANGLALDCRYAGQGRVDRYYSVAEHSVLVAQAARRIGLSSRGVFVALLHDAAEAYLNDLPRAVKQAVGKGYRDVEDAVQTVIFDKYELAEAAHEYHDAVKDLDRRIVSAEKAAIVCHREQVWAADALEPLEGVVVSCLAPPQAKSFFATEYRYICLCLNIKPEEIET